MARAPKFNKGRPLPPVDLSALPKDEIEALRNQAKIQVAKERQAEQREAAIAHFVEAERRASSKAPEDEMVDVFIDLPDFCDRITIDGRVFLYGRTYTVSRPVAEGLWEIMSRTNDHQLEIDGKSKWGHESRRIGLSGRRGQFTVPA